jgi:hypothetical protein
VTRRGVVGGSPTAPQRGPARLGRSGQDVDCFFGNNDFAQPPVLLPRFTRPSHGDDPLSGSLVSTSGEGYELMTTLERVIHVAKIRPWMSDRDISGLVQEIETQGYVGRRHPEMVDAGDVGAWGLQLTVGASTGEVLEVGDSVARWAARWFPYGKYRPHPDYVEMLDRDGDILKTIEIKYP